MTTIPPPTDAFREACKGFGIELSSDELGRLSAFLRVLYEANATTNLTAIRDPAESWLRHIFDALTLLPVLDECQAEGDRLTVCDVGAGCGVPGLPLAIIRPDADVTLVEATGRKCSFLTDAIGSLGISNARVVQERSERVGEYPRGELRDGFDLVTARALGRAPVALELCVPLARVGGMIALIKGGQALSELEASRQALHELHTTHAGTIETPTGTILVFEKTRRTPKKYPRKDGEPKRVPIGGRQAP